MDAIGTAALVPEVVCTFLRRELVHKVADATPNLLGSPLCGDAQQVLGLGKSLFERAEDGM